MLTACKLAVVSQISKIHNFFARFIFFVLALINDCKIESVQSMPLPFVELK